MTVRQNVGSAATIRAVQEFFCMHGRCREVQLSDGLHGPVLLSVAQVLDNVELPRRVATSAVGLRITYRGEKEDLISLGCISRDRLANARYERHEDDPLGALLLVRRKATPGRRRLIELSYFAQYRSSIGMLPGVRTYCADWLEALTARPMLRLVVHNGNPTSPGP